MLEDRKNISADSNRDNQLEEARVFCAMIPGAAALWSRDRSFCLLNEAAQRLINYSEAEIFNLPSIWVERIHPDDRRKCCVSLEKLVSGESVAQCDYRFFPKNAIKPIWIREQSLRRQGQQRTALDTIAAYTDISDLKATPDAKLLIHDLQNCIQKVSMELELLMMDLKRNNSTEFISAIDSINHSLRNLREQVTSIPQSRSFQDPFAILDGIMQKMRKDLNRQRVNLRLVRRESLPMLAGNNDQLRSIFEQVFEFCGAILKQEPNLALDAGPKEDRGEINAEVDLTTSSPDSNEVNEIEAFQPEVHLVGLDVVLAGEILARYHGQVSIQKKSDSRGQVDVIIKAPRN